MALRTAAKPAFDTWLKWVHSTQFAACCMLGLCLICAHRGLVAPWGTLSISHGTISGEFTLWRINVTVPAEAEGNISAKTFAELDIKDGLCGSGTGSSGLLGQNSDIDHVRSTCFWLKVMQTCVVLALIAVILAFLLCGVVLFFIEHGRYVRFTMVASAALSATTSTLAIAAVISAVVVSQGVVAKQPGAGAVCTIVMAIAAFLAVLLEFASWWASSRSSKMASLPAQRQVDEVI